MTTREIMQECCAKDGSISRYAIDRLFRKGDYIYSTNGHLAARIPKSAMPDIGEVENTPNPGSLDWSDTGNATRRFR